MATFLSNRLANRGLIDRNAPLAFTFDGKPYTGYAGDTLASALLANGVTLVGRSFKYHRPRGILTAGSEEPNALVELASGARREPNTRATTTELYEGLAAKSQNRWPSLAFDALSINGVLAPLLAAGFYYKTFMWPASFWEKVYEPLIRRAAGLGRAADGPDPDTYEKAAAFCDVLVIGAGPAGLMAALAAGRAGARVILADENFALGGRLLGDRRTIGAREGMAWAESAGAELASMPDVRVMRRTTVWGAYDSGTYGAVERVRDHLTVSRPLTPRQRLWRIVAKQTIVAAGATERPIVFGNNDRPGVMLAGAARTYINRFAVAPGKTAVVFTNNDDGASTVADLIAAQVEVAALVDTRPAQSPAIRALADAYGIRVAVGSAVADATGRLCVNGARITREDGSSFTIPCDLIAVSGGWNPNLQIATHLGDRPQWNECIAAFVPGTLPKGMSVAGAANGHYDLANCIAAGASAGAAAATAAGFHATATAIPHAEKEPAELSPFWHVATASNKAFVDFQNDVTASDIALAEREGYRSVEHLKRYTTLGMATDQGRTSNVNGLAIMAGLTGKTIAQTGIPMARPPFTPVSLGALAGHHRESHFKPTRLPPSYIWSKEQGAVFVETGLWLRPSYFPRAGEKDWLETVTREVNTTRGAGGICDVSTLGKIDVQGADTAAFLDKLYINGIKTLAVGRARYGCMLREDGILMDDGTIARMGDIHYVVTTTTANAAKVFQHMEYCHQWIWPELDVHMISVTEQWAQFSVAGPRSRDVLRKVVDAEFDITDEGCPHLAAAAITVCGGVKARLFRVSYSGERAYEIAVPARFGDALFRRLMEAGQEFGVTAYGSEALGVMRIEKGHVSGPELNGTTTPKDLGLGGMASKKKDYIGRVLAARPGLIDPERPALVGVRPLDRSARLRSGAHFLGLNAKAVAGEEQGYMTSVAYSPTVGHWIGLGLLRRGPERVGETVRAYDPIRGADTLVEIVSPIFVDPEGERLRG